MPKLTLEVPHKLEKTEAAARLKNEIERARHKHEHQVQEAETHWEGDILHFSLKMFGMKIAGTMEIATQFVRIDMNLPLAAAMFKGAMEEQMRAELERVLG